MIEEGIKGIIFRTFGGGLALNLLEIFAKEEKMASLGIRVRPEGIPPVTVSLIWRMSAPRVA